MHISLDAPEAFSLSHIRFFFLQTYFKIVKKRKRKKKAYFVSLAMFNGTFPIHTVAPGYGDAFKEDQEQQGHSTGRVVVEQFEHIDSSLVTEKLIGVIENFMCKYTLVL